MQDHFSGVIPGQNQVLELSSSCSSPATSKDPWLRAPAFSSVINIAELESSTENGYFLQQNESTKKDVKKKLKVFSYWTGTAFLQTVLMYLFWYKRMGIQTDLEVLTWHIWCDFVPVNLLPFILLKEKSPFSLVQENGSVALGSVQH